MLQIPLPLQQIYFGHKKTKYTTRHLLVRCPDSELFMCAGGDWAAVVGAQRLFSSTSCEIQAANGCLLSRVVT